MRHVDKQTWPRRKQYEVFGALDHPHGGLCANVDLTTFYPAVKQSGHSITAAIVYVLSRAANAIPEFRYRIRGADVVEHEIVHPSITILTNEDLFTFCSIDYVGDFPIFAARAAEKIAYVQENPTLEDEPGRDDYLFMTAIPWVSFTSVTHAMNLNPGDSVPRIAWGKFFEEGECLKMPLAVQGHHGVMDGLHMGRFYAAVQEYFDQPDSVLGEV